MDFSPPRVFCEVVHRLTGNEHLVLWGLAVGVGGAAIGFGELLGLIQLTAFGSPLAQVQTLAGGLTWWHLLLVPPGGTVYSSVCSYTSCFQGERHLG